MKFRPTSSRLDENNTSNPCGAISIVPKRTASVPYFSNRSNGSGEFPNDLLNFLPFSSRRILVKYTSLKGTLSMNSYPDIIIRATQKNMMSGPVTKDAVG